MRSIVQITETHIFMYRAIRQYIYHHRETPDLITISDLSGIQDRKEVLDVLRDLKKLGYLLFDEPQLNNFHLVN